jgi:hypothetical protein
VPYSKLAMASASQRVTRIEGYNEPEPFTRLSRTAPVPRHAVEHRWLAKSVLEEIRTTKLVSSV